MLPLGLPDRSVPHAGTTCDLLRLLPADERGQYQILVDSIACDVHNGRKHPALTEFVKHITLVHKFIMRGNPGDPLRGIVCGVEFGPGFILVNTDRLKKLLLRSKSYMNGGFQRLGYDVMRPSQDLESLLTRLLPNVNPEFFALKQWCVRLVCEDSVICFASNIPAHIAKSFEANRIPCQAMSPSQKTLAELAKKDHEELDLISVESLLNRRPITCS
jgi:hypothetical protein